MWHVCIQGGVKEYPILVIPHLTSQHHTEISHCFFLSYIQEQLDETRGKLDSSRKELKKHKSQTSTLSKELQEVKDVCIHFMIPAASVNEIC